MSGPAYVDVWPDNVTAVNTFIASLTQWRRAGMTGQHVGIDYSVLPTIFELNDVPRDSWKEVFEDIRTMEYAALGQLNKQKD